MSKLSITAITIGATLVVLLTMFFGVKSVENRAIKFETRIEESVGALNSEEVRRVDLFTNMVDAIESYNIHEQETLKLVVEARKQAETGDVDTAKDTLSVVVEQYPELKSQKNYQEAMKEFSVTENRVASNRKAYNRVIREYKSFVRTFPNKQLLSLQGYEVIEYETLNIPVDAKAHTGLFDK